MQLGARIKDRGNVLFSAQAVGDCGPATSLGGYSIIRAGRLEQAVALAGGCPIMGEGGGVEVGELTNHDDRFDEWLTDRLVGGGARPLEAAARGGRS